MEPSRIRRCFCLFFAVTLGLVFARTALATVGVHAPKVDTFDRFDEDQSPLQKGLLDARDLKWRGNIKLGPDPRCSRVIREIGHGKPRIKLCADHDWDQETCLREYCCEQPVEQGGTVTCTGPRDEDILACAHALVEGGDTTVCVAAVPLSPPRPGGSASLAFSPDGPDLVGAGPAPERIRPPSGVPVLSPEAAHTKDCLDEIFVNNRSNHAADCLEDPDRDLDGTIDAKCRHIFEVCDSMPVETARRTRHSASEKARRVQTRTEIFYERPSRMKTPPAPEDEAWDPLQMRGVLTPEERLGVPGGPRPVDTVLGSGSFDPAGTEDCDPLYRCPENDDGDCVDRVTGAHRTDCFEADGRLKTTLEWVNRDEVTCRHIETGDLFEGDECLDQDGTTLATTLVQQIDEDPVDVVNKDGDCKREGTVNDGLRSDCLDADGHLLAGYVWNVGEENCDGTNDDGDCLVIEEEQADPGDCQPCPDPGNCPDQCARGKGWIGVLRVSDDTCVLADGRVFARPHFKELIDEDCATPVDNDRDGSVDEDPPGVLGAPRLRLGLAQTKSDPTAAEDMARCTALYQRYQLAPDPDELPGPDHGCDMTRLMRVHVNAELAASPNREALKARTGFEKFFDVDDQGHWCLDDDPSPRPGCDPGGPRGAVNGTRQHDPDHNQYRFEERRATVDDSFTVKCKPARLDPDGDGTLEWVDTDYDEETGTCLASAQQGPGFAAARATDARCLASNPPPECRQAMMGFTFAPPVLEWGWRVKWQVCILGICIEIFYARVGYEFDLATGVRLPVEIDFDDLPEASLASDMHAFDNAKSRLRPLDFSAAEFHDFCELHHLDAPWYIADCDRFSFPDFLDTRDGDEFVAHYAVFAGLVVRVLRIPIINWAIDSSVDIPAMCTIWKMKDGIQGLSFQDLVKIELGLFEGGDALQALKDNLGNCGSFTTPFGMEPCPPDECATGWRLRAWPFLRFSKHIRADCLEALARGEVFTIKGETRPICTGLTLGYQGASLGIGLTIEANAGSRLITAEQSAGGDAVLNSPPPHPLSFTRSQDEPDSAIPLYPMTVDNYAGETDGTHQDAALLQVDGSTYYLNAIEIALGASLEFGGILSPIPDIGSFTLYNFVFDTGTVGIPIPQHPGTEPVTAAVPVTNYGLTLDVGVPEGAPGRLDARTREIRPGEFGDYEVTITNEGSVPGSFENFACELSNRPYAGAVPSSEVLTFVIDPNTDHDCTNPDGTGHWFGDPYDGQFDDCYKANGAVRDDRRELVDEDPVGPEGETRENRDQDHDGTPDEDPPDVWRVEPAGFPGAIVGPVAAHQAAQPLTLSVSPFHHPLVRPGIYALRVTADSREASQLNLPERDPLGIDRRQSVSLRGRPEAWTGPDDNPHIAFIAVESFFDPQVIIDPPAAAVDPAGSWIYRVEGTNGANDPDIMILTTEFRDFNGQAGCDLVTLGRLPEGSDPDCPYRAVPTSIPTEWLEGTPPSQFGTEDDPLDPLGGASSSFAVQVPPDWAGMDDTIYTFSVTAQSVRDPRDPKARNTFIALHTVRATPESMTRYIGLEINALILEIEAANAQGIATGGLHPILTYPVTLSNQRTLDRILAGNLSGAIQSHRTTVQTVIAFRHALEGSGGHLPASYLSDWTVRANAILADLDQAIAAGSAGSPTAPSVPGLVVTPVDEEGSTALVDVLE